jgi:TM2 domain-containing membrane protein YozV
MLNNPNFAFQGITFEEMAFLEQAVTGLTDEQMRIFQIAYSEKRKKDSDVQLYCVLGLLVCPGLQRFILGQIGMGILYLFTWGLCVIGSIVDIVNYKKLALEYNKGKAFECYQIAKMNA